MAKPDSSRIFIPLLAGASLRDRVVASVGALVGISLAGLICAAMFPVTMPWIIAPIGASAVLLFAVPASPLAQPWSIVGGNVISGLFGVVVAQAIGEPAFAAALAVSTAILVMSLARCLHPPGGAVALSAVLGWQSFSGHVVDFLVPVLLNSLILVAIGMLFHRFSGHSYPHRARPVDGKAVPQEPVGLLMDDIDGALADLGETFDISREDLALLLARAEAHAAERVANALLAMAGDKLAAEKTKKRKREKIGS
ncbi:MULTISPECIES: HPP family protein [unclassified Sphingopyxis]|uniref:HPP family protein n=1 Tax=unclassified Sphingopyxis TaxID=2614943 RepID=UPI000B0B1D5C|nr:MULTISPECIES: HPP family protein [unclassified Sphingopyxis]